MVVDLGDVNTDTVCCAGERRAFDTPGRLEGTT
jgi:hypothetical protein